METAARPTATSRLSPAQLNRRCDPATFAFETTAALEPYPGLPGQERALEAMGFGLAVREASFNVFVSGPQGTGKARAVQTFLVEAAAKRPVPPDWCYVHNFADPSRPRALRLAPGMGRRLRDDLRALIRSARTEIPRAFESEEYLTGREAIVNEVNRKREAKLEQLTARAQALGFQLQMTPMGIGIIPVLGNRPLSEEDLAGLRPEMRELIDRHRVDLEADVHEFMKSMRAIERESTERLGDQDREVALHAAGGLVDDLTERYEQQPEVDAYLEALREGILGDIALFRSHPEPKDGQTPDPSQESAEHALHERAFRKYEVNVVVDNGDTAGAPVVTELNPTYANLIGRVEREVLFGALVTDFTLISAGALQRANGGYLVLRATDLLRTPMAWEGLKRALREASVTVEDVSEAMGLTETRGLRPDPIPIDVKLFLIGEPSLYATLYTLDPDFRELFKVRADFDVQMERTPESELTYARLIRGCSCDGALPVDRTGVARLIEESSRLAEDQRKLSARIAELNDLLHEARYYAEAAGAGAIGADHVRTAVEKRRYRSALPVEYLNQAVQRGVLLLQPRGTATGQIHGLAVIESGGVEFGRPSRITATVGAGRDGLLDIERQVELGGPIHSKGMLILGGYLMDTYAHDKPLALSARLVFEQSYSGVEGDSASLAELLALLSRLADVPLSQEIAVTGSVNQRGEVQAVGGVNAKIEGYFEVCNATGLTGTQGVILPASNVEHLMLRDDVVEAVAAGRFHVYGVRSVDEGLDLLSGLEAGTRGPDGAYAPATIHARIDARLTALASTLRDFGSPAFERNGHAHVGTTRKTNAKGRHRRSL